MKYVLDSSVALKWALPEVDSGKAIRIRDDYKNAVHDLIAPDIFTPELANALATAERQGRIKPGEAGSLLYDLVTNTPAIHPCPDSSFVRLKSPSRRGKRSTIASILLSPKRRDAR